MGLTKRLRLQWSTCQTGRGTLIQMLPVVLRLLLRKLKLTWRGMKNWLSKMIPLLSKILNLVHSYAAPDDPNHTHYYV